MALSFFSYLFLCISIALKYFVSKMTKHLQLNRSASSKEIIGSPQKTRGLYKVMVQRTAVHCVSLEVFLIVMLGRSHHPAGGHIIELILSINSDNNKGD